MYKNKHVVVAMIVAPILALISYFTVDQLVSEKPQAAQAGGSYKLVEKPNCRYRSGVCDLKNADFEVRLTTQFQAGERMLLKLSSRHPLDGAKVAVVSASELQGAHESGQPREPVNMQPVDESRLSWRTELPRVDSDSSRLQLVFAANQVLYFAETHLTFTTYQTSFEKDFRHNAPRNYAQ